MLRRRVAKLEASLVRRQEAAEEGDFGAQVSSHACPRCFSFPEDPNDGLMGLEGQVRHLAEEFGLDPDEVVQEAERTVREMQRRP